MHFALIPARRLTIHLSRSIHSHEHGYSRHPPLGTELLLRAHRAGMAGATTVRGVGRFGHSYETHRQPVWGLVDRAAIIVVAVEIVDRTEALVAAIRELFSECLAIVGDLQVVPRRAYAHDPSQRFA